MSFIIRKLIQKALEKGAKIDPTEVMTQMNTHDLILFLKELL